MCDEENFMNDHDEKVSKLERELRFFPVHNDRPNILAKEQIRLFNEKGYLTGLTAFNEAEADANRKDFDDILLKVTAEGKDSYAIDRYHDRFSAIYDLAKNPAIVEKITDLLGPNVVCWATHYFCKMPGDGKAVSWHQDCSYWAVTPSKTVTVWLAIDDVDAANGCMRVIPGSHIHGHLKFRESDPSEHNVLTQSVDDPFKYGDEEVLIELRAGQFSIHSDLLLHGSLANTSSRRRCGLTLRYCPVDVRTYWGWNEKGILVSGSDPDGHWKGIARPE
jgi:non-haem Fe2+, alpha-ketoglutarate-dependent halogenase